ncbi:MAG: polyisoprenoid-binding protein YceI [Cyclobacteriaceae bacterium]
MHLTHRLLNWSVRTLTRTVQLNQINTMKMKTLKVSIFAFAAIVLSSFSNTAETIEVDTTNSSVKWTGYHLAKAYEHWGNVQIKSGTIEMEGDEITGGSIVMDMTTITDGDLEDPKNAKLVGHLKSDDFFAADKFPEATLVIKSATKDGINYSITADIIIRGISQEIAFDATKSEDNTFNATFTIDRTIHEVMYGWTVENAMLDNDIKLEIALVLAK